MDQYFNRLTQGAIGHILQNTIIEEPILQMIAYKCMPTDDVKRYRLVLSDGIYTYQCCVVMGNEANRVENNEFDRYCLLKISKYMLNVILDRIIIVLADLKLLIKGDKIGKKLGDPVPFGQKDAPPLSNFVANYHLLNAVNDSIDWQFNEELDFDNSKNTTNRQTLNAKLAISIESITPYSDKWIIKGRCTSKTSKKSWSNAKGEGSYFGFDIKDNTGDIHLTAFKIECDKFFEMIKVGTVYLISKGQIKQKNQQYTRTTSNYQITINFDTIIEQCEDDTDCPIIQYNFVSIDSLENHFASIIDVIGIIKSFSEVRTFVVKKTNKESQKRDIIIVDQSRCEVSLTVWGELATKFTGELEDVIVIRSVKVGEFNGITLSTTQNSVIEMNPLVDQAQSLKEWYDRVKDNLETRNLTQVTNAEFKADWRNMNEITSSNIVKENGVVLQTKATIYRIDKVFMYKACECKKKLVDLNNGFYRCEKCQKEVDRFDWKMIISSEISDHTQNVSVQLFADNAQKLIGRDMNELGEIYERNPNELYDILNKINFTSYIFELKSTMENFKENTQIRTQVLNMKPIDYSDYGKLLLKQINEMND